ncbi:MAG: CBS domain-containing protein [Rhodospirillales bacterium]|nr:CBS domain-containing protein [Rhodospirillales bacterium]
MNVEAILGSKGRDVLTVSPDASILDASNILSAKKIGALVVSADGVTALGIITERDIVNAIGARGPSALDQTVDSLMTRDIRTCALDDTGHELLSAMTDGRFRHVPVIENGKLCGIVSIGDVVKSRLEEITREADAMREYITSN